MTDWLRPDHSRPSSTMGALPIAYPSMKIGYGPKWFVVASRVIFMVWGLPIRGHILQPLCLLGLIWRIFVIGCMCLMHQCRSSSRKRIRGTWSCMSIMRQRRRNGGSRYSPWNREWCPYTPALSRCRVIVHHSMHSFHAAPPPPPSSYNHKG